jgi:hypothetical protein
MGKRELLLVAGFGVVGLLVYQLTMPATADTGGGFSAWWTRLRSHMAGSRVELPYERKQEVAVPAAARTVAFELDRASVTVTGEARETVGAELTGAVWGADQQLAAKLAQQIGLEVAEDGAVVRVKVTLPQHDELTRRPRVQLVLKIPARLGVDVRLNGGEMDVTGVAAVHVAKATGRVRLAAIAGAVTGELGPGDVEIDGAGSVTIETIRSQVRIANVAGALEAQVRRGDFRARSIGGATRLEVRDIEGELEDLGGPLKLTGSGGEVRVRDARGPIEAQTERTTLRLTPNTAVPITATTERDEIEITLPPGGVFLDLAATDGGEIRAPEQLIAVKRSDDQATASGPVRGGGPRVVLRTTHGSITVR